GFQILRSQTQGVTGSDMREVVQCWRLHSHCLCLLACILGSRQTLQLGFSRGAEAHTRREYPLKGRALSNAIESTFHFVIKPCVQSDKRGLFLAAQELENALVLEGLVRG